MERKDAKTDALIVDGCAQYSVKRYFCKIDVAGFFSNEFNTETRYTLCQKMSVLRYCFILSCGLYQSIQTEIRQGIFHANKSNIDTIL